LSSSAADADTPALPEDSHAPTLRMKSCAKCGSGFSGDARFCPFDGEPLGTAAPPAPSSDVLLGTLIDGRYEVQAVLGEGGMGKVYRVRHRAIQRLFALKVLRKDLAADSDLGERFTREARAAASISHPNVVQITDFGSLPSGQPYFVMELLVGESLSDVLAGAGPLPVARGARLLTQIVDALAAAHHVGVVHRDLKPDNVVIYTTPSGEHAKVLDFGLAKVAGLSRLTREGLVFGTPHYMSPEQASGNPVDQRTDIYALGVLMYQMFTGRVPFEADTYMGVLTQHIYVEPAPPSVHLGTVAGLGAIEQIVLRCLEKKPERRFSTMLELRQALDRVVRFEPTGVVRVARVELGEAQRGWPKAPDAPSMSEEVHAVADPVPDEARRLAPMLAIAGAAALLVVGSLVWANRSLSPPRVVTGASEPPATSSSPPSSSAREVTSVIVPPASASSPLPTAVEPVQAPGASNETQKARRPKVSPPAAPTGLDRAHAVPPAATVKYGKKQNNLGNDGIVDPWAQ
jgi:eukaryotic-like serine/threonine-protein kinase